LVEAFVYLRIRPGAVTPAITELATKQGVRRAVVVVGDWDVMALVDGPDMATLATTVLSQIHPIEGVERTRTAPLVPPDLVGMGFAAPPPPSLLPGEVCYVHIKAQAGAVEGLVERLAEMEEIAGVAVVAGEYDIVADIRRPWEAASGTILSGVQSLPGISSTTTLIGVAYEEPPEDRDQFSTWS
jgi:DNA-binding Lrp family transcriptional regulator